MLLLRWVFCMLVLECAAIAPCFADALVMDNGDRLTGHIARLENGKLVLATDYAGEINIELGKVSSLTSDQVMTVELDKTRRMYGFLSGSGKQLKLRSETDAEPVDLAPDQVSNILPGRLTGREWKTSGHINVAASDSKGNTVVNHSHLDAETVTQREKFRITAGATLNRTTDHNVESESNALGYLKYDRFLDRNWYGYGNTTVEHDKFKDIKLRDTIGLGRGHDAIVSSRTNLSLEGGLSYVFTDFYSTPDQHYPAVRLALRYDHFLVENRLQFFHQSEVFIGLDSLKRSFAHTKTGLRFPLRNNFVATLEYDVDWDGDPPAGNVTTDRDLLFTLGYHW
jgi:putative salt-induced outer membrane protein YdiY